jgi:hypothetical protein
MQGQGACHEVYAGVADRQVLLVHHGGGAGGVR